MRVFTGPFQMPFHCSKSRCEIEGRAGRVGRARGKSSETQCTVGRPIAGPCRRAGTSLGTQSQGLYAQSRARRMQLVLNPWRWRRFWERARASWDQQGQGHSERHLRRAEGSAALCLDVQHAVVVIHSFRWNPMTDPHIAVRPDLSGFSSDGCKCEW